MPVKYGCPQPRADTKYFAPCKKKSMIYCKDYCPIKESRKELKESEKEKVK